jgi:hypothetical protein
VRLAPLAVVPSALSQFLEPLSVDDVALAIAEFDEEAAGHPKRLEQTGWAQH